MTRAYVPESAFQGNASHAGKTVDVSGFGHRKTRRWRSTLWAHLTGLIAAGFLPIGESRIHLTYRTLEDGQKVVACIRDAVSRTVLLERIVNMDSFTTDAQDVDQLGTVLTELLGLSIKGQHYDSASEAGFSSSLGVPTICNMGPEGEHIHSLNEYLVPSSIVKRCKLIALSALQASRVFPRPELAGSGYGRQRQPARCSTARERIAWRRNG